MGIVVVVLRKANPSGKIKFASWNNLPGPKTMCPGKVIPAENNCATLKVPYPLLLAQSTL